MSPLTEESWRVVAAESVLDLYLEHTPSKYHEQRREARPLEHVLQDAGVRRVGDISTQTKLAMANRSAMVLAEEGYLEKVKDGGGPVTYRLTQLGERRAFQRKLDQLEFDRKRDGERRAQEARRLAETVKEQREKIGRLHVALDEAHRHIVKLERPWWKKVLRRG